MSDATAMAPAPKRKVTRRKPTRQKTHATTENAPASSADSTSAYLISIPDKVIVHIPPHELAVHPDLRDVAVPSAAEDAQLEDSIREHGILHPLIANSAKQVLDGGRRLGKALLLALPTVPVIYDDRVDAVAVALSTALARRHLSQGQRALYIFKLHRDLSGERRASQSDAEVSFRELERRYGLCDSLFGQLSAMRKDSTLAVWTEIVRKIESGDSSLAEQYKGYLGRKSTKDRPRAEEKTANHVTRLLNGVGSIGQQGKHWDSFSTDHQGDVLKKAKEALSKWPPNLLAAFNKLSAEIFNTKAAQDQ